MSLSGLAATLPPLAADLKINVARLAAETALSEQQKWGCFLACAYALGQKAVLKAAESDAEAWLTPDAREAARTAATIMAMNTVYYGAVNLLDNHDYRGEAPALSMAALASPSVDKIDFELWSFAVSALSNCKACLNSHESELHKRGVALERIHAALRIAAVTNAVATVLRAEESRSSAG